MTTRVVKTETDRQMILRILESQKIPFTIDVTKGKRRSVEQNRLQRLWLNEAAEQLGDRTAEEIRGECKLTHGVPMMRAESEVFREHYDRWVKPLPYEQKLALMMEPLDLPVTRAMTTEQNGRYLDAMFKGLVEQGIQLTVPEWR